MSQESQAISDNISMLLTQSRTAEARAELERLLALDPDDPEGRSVAGDVYAYTGAHSAAYKQYNLAAETYNRLGRADKALAVHHKILELDAGMLDAATQTRLRLLALLVGAEDAIVSGQHERAVAGFQEAIRQFPNHTITYQRLASLLVRMGRVDEAAAQYLTVARAFHAHGVHAKARPYFERVLELRPDHSEALERLLASLRSEGLEADGQRFVKAAAVAHLQAGRNEDAAALFESLPEAQREGASALGAALLLQSGEVGQAERMAAQLELARPELRDWFKRLGRAALERGDSVAADAYFRWAQGEAQRDAPVVPMPVPAGLAQVEPEREPEVSPTPAPVPAPVPTALSPAMPKAAPMGLGVPPPPPGLGVPPPSIPAATPVAAQAVPPTPAAQPVVVPLPPAAPAPPMVAAPPAVPVISVQTPSTEDQGILLTMGEMCLAEEMFEEAKQVFERLTKADPGRGQYWDQLNRARAGLGLSPVMQPTALQRPSVPLPVHLVATSQAPPLPMMAVPAPGPAEATPKSTVSIPLAPVPTAPVPPLAPPIQPLAPLAAVESNAPAWLPGMGPPAEAAPIPLAQPAAAAPAPPPATPPPAPAAVPGPAPAAPPVQAPLAAPAPAAPSVPVPERIPVPPAPPVPGPLAAPAAVAGPTPAPMAEPKPALPPAPLVIPAPLQLPGAPASPVPALAAPAFKPVVLPRRPAAVPVRAPSRNMAPAVPAPAGRIERATYTVQLGELPPAVPSALDDADEIIE
jgi:tetratricopeptide (TPR) repeat protein